MKIEIEIPDDLLVLAESTVEKRGISLSTLIEVGLRQVLDALIDSGSDFRLRKHTFRGEGLAPGSPAAGWDEISALAYEGHGG